MINLEQIREKLENILNGVDIESEPISTINDNFFFRVNSEGLELRDIGDNSEGKNFIPVFISSVGGNFNPIPSLKESLRNVQVDIFYPVRFKNYFYEFVEQYLVNTFVGKILTYNNKKALSNLSVFTTQEIQQFDVQMFSKWIETNYKKKIVVSEQWITTSFTLYLNEADKIGEEDGFIYTNDISLYLSLKTDSETLTEKAIINDGNLSYGTSPNGEQILGEKESQSLASTSNANIGVTINIKNNTFFNHILFLMQHKLIQNYPVFVDIQLFGKTIYSREMYITSNTIPLGYGKLATMTLTLGNKVEVE